MIQMVSFGNYKVFLTSFQHYQLIEGINQRYNKFNWQKRAMGKLLAEENSQYQENSSSNEKILEETCDSVINPVFVPRERRLTKRPKSSRYAKITKSIKQVPMYLKKGTNTQKYNIVELFEQLKALVNMPQEMFQDDTIDYRKNYIWVDQNGKKVSYFKEALQYLEKVVKNLKGNGTMGDLKNIFGMGSENVEEGKISKQFVINRMNAITLNQIYEEKLEMVIFEKGKKEDKMTDLLFLLEYRSRLFNPELCENIECIRPLMPRNA